MYLDVVDLREFYSRPRGRIAHDALSAAFVERWPDLDGLRLIGFGYATPYLMRYVGGAERLAAFMPAAQGVVNWPTDRANTTALVLAGAFPLPDASIDRILAVHALEMADNPEELLREMWRVLAPGGRLLIAVPNRRGLWAQAESTPFGFGRPFSRGQLTELLRAAMFSPVAWQTALHAAPLRGRLWRRSARAWDRIGRRLWPAFAGVIIVEATKQLYQGVPARARSGFAGALQPVLVPTPSTRALPRQE